MGQVYRATDTNLKRQVALKVCRTRSRLTPSGWRASSGKRKCSPR